MSHRQACLKMVLCVAVMLAGRALDAASAQEILEASGVKGGLVVHLGCGDGELTMGLQASDSYVVQGLDKDAQNVAAAREKIRSKKCYGKVSVDTFDGAKLPYVDNLVNLVVVESAFAVPMEEVMRVLAPSGVAYVKDGGNWKKTVKPWPKEIDEWTHYLHDPQGTSVSSDQLAGHSKGLKWDGGPFWARSHEHTASMTAMVSTGGRIFYVMDEGPTDSIQLPAEFVLVARDAFNGTVLWKRPLPGWFNALYPLKSGPGWLPRRLVAIKDRVYVAPGVGKDAMCLDAATGKVVHTYSDTATTFEFLVSDGVLIAAVDTDRKPCDYQQQHPNCWKERDRASKKWGWTAQQGTRVIKAIQAEDGKLLWKREAPVAPMTLAADERMVCFHDGTGVLALDRKTGEDLWKADVLPAKLLGTGYGGPRLVIHKDRIVYSPMSQMAAVNAKTGKVLWSVKGKPRSGHLSLEDFFILDDTIWVLQRGNNGAFTTYSLKDGSKIKDFRNPIKSFYIHQRCHPGKATRRFQLPPMMGMMVYDMEKDAWFNNHWVRGGIYGAMPANGLIYVPPHACACYYQSKLNGFNAMNPEPEASEAPPAEKRLVKGPAYGSVAKDAEYPASAWPTFRHDNGRSGYVKTDVPAEIKEAWKSDFGTKVSQPVVADGKVFFSAIDQHTVHALDAASGKAIWHFTAGGRINSAPALYRGMALFGCADGCVYALNASDGKLAWKFCAAPTDRRLMSYGQPESVWPLAGNVLIQGGKLYCVAGRSMFMDGGLRMLILNPETGEMVSENVMDRRVPGTDKQLDDLIMGKHMPVGLPDILSSDGEFVYMKSQAFKMDGKRVRVRPQRPDTQYDKEVHLFAPTSFLDDAWHQRTYWIYGRAAGEGWAEFQFPPKRVPCGRVLCIDEQNAYGYARDPELVCNTSVSEYRLYSANKIPARKVGIPKLEGTWIKGQYPIKDPLASNTVDWKQLAKQPKEKLSALTYNWVHEEPDVMAKAMVLANDQLFIAGPRDVVDEKAMWGRSNEKTFKEKMVEQTAWLKGQHGSFLQVYDKKDGRKLAEHKLDAMPAFDGLIAAEGCLYLVTADGTVRCYRGK